MSPGGGGKGKKEVHFPKRVERWGREICPPEVLTHWPCPSPSPSSGEEAATRGRKKKKNPNRERTNPKRHQRFPSSLKGGTCFRKKKNTKHSGDLMVKWRLVGKPASKTDQAVHRSNEHGKGGSSKNERERDYPVKGGHCLTMEPAWDEVVQWGGVAEKFARNNQYLTKSVKTHGIIWHVPQFIKKRKKLLMVAGKREDTRESLCSKQRRGKTEADGVFGQERIPGKNKKARTAKRNPGSK